MNTTQVQTIAQGIERIRELLAQTEPMYSESDHPAPPRLGPEYDALRRVLTCDGPHPIGHQCPRCGLLPANNHPVGWAGRSRAAYWEAAVQRDAGVLVGALQEAVARQLIFEIHYETTGDFGRAIVSVLTLEGAKYTGAGGRWAAMGFIIDLAALQVLIAALERRQG